MKKDLKALIDSNALTEGVVFYINLAQYKKFGQVVAKIKRV